MSHRRMHDHEIETNVELVRALLRSQHPRWAELPIERVPSAGTDNAMYRLGDALAMRLPRIDWAAESLLKERRWLPVLGERLPLPVPHVIASGQPACGYPYGWNVVRWLPGEVAEPDRVRDEARFALDLAAFVGALRTIDATDGPTHRRGLPVRANDAPIRAAVAGLRGEADGDAILAMWEQVLAVDDYEGPPVWFHGDLSYLNLLLHDGSLSAVVDWGTCGVGDPAIDTVIVWSMRTAEARATYRAALDIDDATWQRGKGWALCGVGAIPYYRATNPALVADKLRAIEAVLDDR
jgi:aminoglycoside phosphotransferase (APT) family kinase protein